MINYTLAGAQIPKIGRGIYLFILQKNDKLFIKILNKLSYKALKSEKFGTHSSIHFIGAQIRPYF